MTSALQDFTKSMDLATGLIVIEGRYKDPPRTASSQTYVAGLRGGAAVLMVAALERYLRELMVETLATFDQKPPPVAFEYLPRDIRLNAVWSALTLAMTGPRHGLKSDRHGRYPIVHAAATRVVDGRLDPQAFADTKGNPGSEVVKALFKNTGVDNVFQRIRADFDAAWAKPESTTFLSDKLDEIVSRRHRVAHSADALSIARSDLTEAARFLIIIATAIDALMIRHVNAVVARAKKRELAGTPV